MPAHTPDSVARDLPQKVLVLGIGNVLWADEGFGVRCVEALAQRRKMPDQVRLLDGGTQGLYLLPFVEDADALIVFDAIDFGLVPGTLKVLRDGDVPSFMGAKKMSLHQTGFQEVLSTAALMGVSPGRLTLIGCQPVELEDFGGSLRDAVSAQVPRALQLAEDELASWGITLSQGATQTDDLVDISLARERYEAGRPSEGEACRVGDARFMNKGGR